MPLFHIKGEQLQLARPSQFAKEKELQSLIEANLEVVFNCRLVATEFSTGPRHGGRMDSLALSEDNNPVIIEYKKVESSELINQSLFYLDWLSDHRGDFEVLCRKAFGDKIEIDWGAIRVICLAPGYKKYDLHAVNMMGAAIELWQYRLYANGSLYLEEINGTGKRERIPDRPAPGPNEAVIEEELTSGQKGALTRRTGVYTVQQHVEATPEEARLLLEQLREVLLEAASGEAEEAPKKLYIAYKITQNYACLRALQSKFQIHFKLNPDEIEMGPHMRDVRNVGHYGTGDVEYTVHDETQLKEVRKLAEMAVDAIGG